MEPKARKLVVYRAKTGKVPFNDWLDKLKDPKIQAMIDLRVGRLSLGLFGDSKSLGDEVYELRIHHGPGYRVYYGLDGDTLVVLLLGGDKSTQTQDILKAKAYFEDYRRPDDA